MSLRRAVLAIVFLLSFACVSQAGLISEDVCYWYRTNTGGIGSEFNPSTDWLNSHLPSLVLKIQQSVFDPSTSELMLIMNGEAPVPGGYIYAYSITNLGWKETITLGGLDGFGVQWAVEPVLVTIDRYKTSPYWKPMIARKRDGCPVDGPAWIWHPDVPQPGLLPGGTQGGLWAVSLVGVDTIVDAVGANGCHSANPVFIWGKTTGPVPEPSSVATLALGLVGLIPVLRCRWH